MASDVSPLLSHLALNPKEHPESLLRTLQATEEPKVISWVTTGLELEVDKAPKHTALKLFQSFANLGGSWSEDKEEAAAGINGALGELLQLHEEDKLTLRERLHKEVATGKLHWLRQFLSLMKQPARPLAPLGAAVARSCEVLEQLCRGQEELTTLLHRHHVLVAVGARLLAATKAAPSSAWLHFATFPVSLMEALMAEKDTDRFKLADPELFLPIWASRKPEPLIEGLLTTLRCSEGQNTLLQSLSLKALGHLLRHHSPQANFVRRTDAAKLSLELLSRCACDEEKVVVALEFLSLAGLPQEVPGATSLVQSASARLPRSQIVQELVAKTLQPREEGLPNTGRTGRKLAQ